jgi:hypothetical protein
VSYFSLYTPVWIWVLGHPGSIAMSGTVEIDDYGVELYSSDPEKHPKSAGEETHEAGEIRFL